MIHVSLIRGIDVGGRNLVGWPRELEFFVRSAGEGKAIIEANPFPKQAALAQES